MYLLEAKSLFLVEKIVLGWPSPQKLTLTDTEDLFPY
jgi:hypothetical protein